MGAVCCCFTLSDDVTSDSPNDSLCLNFRLQDLLHQYEALFGGGEPRVRNNSTNYQDVALADPDDTISQNNSRLRGPQAYQEIEIRKLERGSSHSQTGNISNADFELLGKLTSKSKQVVLDCEKDYCAPKACFSFLEVEPGYPIPSSEDEDVCPTCLEDYTIDNPKIITKCSHHYHLSCIFEWQERSETCPVCGVVLEFEEISC
ncbi:unnamed protein product [Cuscuta europaea]|uniref:RING-type E3 ubiquitin transferase n=1 Tax=Cuscuta europaea TaxID=41803 RepID=A0A9P0ZY57_CUSEU|nr:unnamed protein product [Cuscuta europaea]